MNVLTSGGDVVRVRGEPLDKVSVTGMERCREAANATSDVDDKSTGNPGIAEDVFRRTESASHATDRR